MPIVDDDPIQRHHLTQAYNAGGWDKVLLVVRAFRDAREKVLVDRVEHYLEDLIETTGQENPTLTVRDVRARLFDTPQ